MGEQGASLQKCNQELVKGLELIKQNRNAIASLIEKEELVKASLEKDLAAIQSRLNLVNESLEQKKVAKERYDAMIKESEDAYMKILEGSESLLAKVQRELDTLSRPVP